MILYTYIFDCRIRKDLGMLIIIIINIAAFYDYFFPSSSFFLYWEGVMPVYFLKAL